MHRLILFVLFLVGLIGRTQEQFPYTKIDGLPSNNVYEVVQGPDSHLWAVTEDGVTKFDGSTFKVYTTANGLACNENFEIKFSGGKLHVLGFNGQMSTYNEGADSFDAGPVQFKSFISEFYRDDLNRNIYTSFGDGLKIQEGGVVHEFKESNGLPDNAVCYAWSWGADIYAITKTGIERINEQNEISRIFTFPKRIHFARAVKLEGKVLFTAGEQVYCVEENEKVTTLAQEDQITALIPTKFQKLAGELIISSYNGAHLVSVQHDTIRIKHSILSGISVTSLCTDHEGNYWASTLDHGLIKIPDIYLFQLTKESTFGIEAKGNQILVGAKGFKYFNLSSELSLIPLKFRHTSGLPKVRDIKFDGNSLWLENDGALIRKNQDKLTYYRTGLAVVSVVDSSNYIIGHVKGAHLVSDKDLETLSGEEESLIVSLKSPLINERVYEAEPYCDGHFLGGISGLYAFTNGEVNRVKGLPKDKALYIATRERENLIVYENLGAYYFNDEDTIHIFSNSSLNRLVKCAEITADEIIIGTNKGVYFLDKSDRFRIKNRTILTQTEIRDVCVSGDTLLISSEQGLFYSAYPLGVKKGYKIPLEITSFKAIGQKKDVDNIELAYNENNITIAFKAISFNRENLVYSYQLNDDSWTEFEGNLNLSQLAQGSYNLKVRASDNFMQSEVVEVQFEINPPWWKTSWFYTLIFLLIGLIIYLFFKIRVLTYNRDVVRELMLLFRDKVKKDRFIVVKNVKDGAKTKVQVGLILFVKSAGNYVELHQTNKKTVVRQTLKSIHEDLDKAKPNLFVRVHKSYLVNVEKVEAIHSEFLKIGEESIPIGKNFQQEVKVLFKELKSK